MAGALVLAGGMTLAAPGFVRLVRPRRAADVEWERRHPALTVLLDAIPGLIASERHGAIASITAGAVAIAPGAAALAAD